MAPGLSARRRVNEAQAALARGDRAGALRLLRSGVVQPDDDAAAVGDWGVSFVQCGELAEGVPFFEAAARRAPGDARAAQQLLLAWKTTGEQAFAKGRFPEAAQAFARCAELVPSDPTFPSNASLALLRAGCLDDALGAAEEAAARDAGYAPGWSHRGLVHLARGELTRAEEALAHALSLTAGPARAQILVHRALVEDRAGRLEAAAATLESALALDPSLPEAWNNLGGLRREQGEVARALAAYDQALALRPGWPLAISGRLLAASSVLEQPDALGKMHRLLVAQAEPAPAAAALAARDPRPDRRLTVAYLSPDLREHPVGRLLAPVLEARDLEGSRVLAYADGSQPDRITARIRAAVDGFTVVTGLSRDELAAQLVRDGVDVLVDLAGHTAGGRWPDMMPRLAPVQVFYLGYPGDTGLGTLDARLSDSVADPEDADDPEGTPVMRLEGGFLAFAPDEDEAPPPARAEGPPTFGSFNNAAKLSDATVALWSALLREVPEARLLLKARAFGDASTCARVAARFAHEGIASSRLLFRGHTASAEDHVRAYGEMDVALDPTPYAGTTTTCEALWMGVPVVTLRGPTHAARVGASLLHSLGRPDWIAEDAAGYVAKARELLRDEDARRAWRNEARAVLRGSSLGDPGRVARELEKAYRGLWRARVAAGARVAGR